MASSKRFFSIERALGQATRCGKLEPIRQYAREKLIESSEEATMRQTMPRFWRSERQVAR
jgi:hypothetical protein